MRGVSFLGERKLQIVEMPDPTAQPRRALSLGGILEERDRPSGQERGNGAQIGRAEPSRLGMVKRR